MSKFEYEKNRTIASLKNEIYGLKQLIADFERLEALDMASIDGKVINVKVERLLHAQCEGYVSASYKYNKHVIDIMVKDRYNNETTSYIGHYDRYTVDMGVNTTISEAGKQTDRFNAIETIANVKKERERLQEQLSKLENELANIDETLKEYQKVYEMVKEFKKGRTSFFLDNFKDLNGFY